jgi:hypothetical protein
MRVIETLDDIRRHVRSIPFLFHRFF